MKFVTIGVHGFSEAAFFDTLQRAGVDTLCDIRWRRAVRGAQYAFANRSRLEKRLAGLRIRYLHLRHLAAPPALRQRQAEADKKLRVAKRQRAALSAEFIAGYQAERLSAFDSWKFLDQLGPAARTVALLCVEREPAACHRSLLAERLQADLGQEIELAHLTP